MSGGPLVLGTAGHVDHGKTALVGALTGRDTDRLPEEKARGISIALGFAPLELADGRVVSLVDVPGHERFVRHMVAGASGIDGYLMCVAADDGVMPQTVEHMAVLRLLGVSDGVAAITKSDLLDPALAAADVRELVGDGPEIVPVSAVTGSGIGELRAALERLAARLERRTSRGAPRLYVDRAFSVAGAGTVATGTLWGGPVAAGDRVVVFPAGRRGRVRTIQAHDVAVPDAAGGRVALNLAGLERGEVPRGSCVVREGDGWLPTERVDVALTWLADAGSTLATRRRLQVFLGTTEVSATCVLLEAGDVQPGETAYAQLRFDAAVVAAANDRLVLRSAARRTVGGAVVIDPAAQRHGRGSGAAERLRILERGDVVEVLRLRLDEAGGAGVTREDVTVETWAAAGGVMIGVDRGVSRDVIATARSRLDAALGRGPVPIAAVGATLGVSGDVADHIVEAMLAAGVVQKEGGTLARPGSAELDDRTHRRIEEVLVTAGRRPPGIAELAEIVGAPHAEVRHALVRLRADGRVIDGGDLFFHRRAAEEARAVAIAALGEGAMTLSALRDLWGVGRRHALALAAYLDASGATRRVGDERVLRRGVREAPP